jgi:hypothetical protein
MADNTDNNINALINENNVVNDVINDYCNTKKINIIGTNNKYMMKKVLKDNKKEKEIKKRVESKKWNFSVEDYNFDMQLQLVNDILKNDYSYTNEISKIIIQQINKKISSYKQQDLCKKHYDMNKFLIFNSVIDKMIECELRCRYCKKEMYVLYDISREMCQWSVDRIDNDTGHNNDNFHLACLECNLKRRRRTDEKFLFTKQLNIIKCNN